MSNITAKQMKELIINKLNRFFGVEVGECSKDTLYKAVILTIRDILTEKRNAYHEVTKKNKSKKVYCSVGYCDNISQAHKVVEMLKPHLLCDEYVYMQIGNVVVTHVGMGAVGVAFYQL